MRKVPAILLFASLLTASAQADAGDIVLRLRPEADAPIINRITATEKVLLDAAPAGEKGDWMRLELKIPFEGYVPEAALTKNFAIVQDTPVHFLPDANSETITRAKDGDLYEVKRVKDDWAAVRFEKALTTYFRAGALPSKAPEPVTETPPEAAPQPPVLDLTIEAPTHTPQPNAAEFVPSLGVGQTRPQDLPPENVVWKTRPRAAVSGRESQPEDAAAEPEPPQLPNGIMVSPDQTQAREAAAEEAPPTDKPVRLLVGNLVREIDSTDPAYPVRLRSEQGRLIAYVDFSGFFIDDLSPYLDERVYLRGHLRPVRPTSRELVIFVRDIQIAE